MISKLLRFLCSIENSPITVAKPCYGCVYNTNLEKHCLGTNFPKSVFNPRGFPRTAYYDELARIQNELHAKKQQQKNNSPQTTTGFNAVPSANTTSNAASTVIYVRK